MKNITKRIVILLTTAVICLTFFACSGSIRVVEVYHKEEKIPGWEDSSQKRVFSIPKVKSNSKGAKQFNAKLKEYCEELIDEAHEGEKAEMLVTIDFESSVYKGIAAITVNEVYAVMGSDVYWTNSKIFYFDSKKGSEMTDWKPYVRAVGYDPDKFERAFKETDVYLNFVAPDEYDEDWSVSNVSIIGVMIGDTETMVSI